MNLLSAFRHDYISRSRKVWSLPDDSTFLYNLDIEFFSRRRRLVDFFPDPHFSYNQVSQSQLSEMRGSFKWIDVNCNYRFFDIRTKLSTTRSPKFKSIESGRTIPFIGKFIGNLTGTLSNQSKFTVYSLLSFSFVSCHSRST